MGADLGPRGNHRYAASLMTQFIAGNYITLLRGGAEYFPALTAAFDAARREIHLETYIFEADATGRAVAAALERAARRGVLVHLLVDGFGSHDLDLALVREMEDAGVRFLVYRKNISPWTLRRARLRRMHRKIAVVDARIAFVGGINVVDNIDEPGTTEPRFDFAVRVEGPLVRRVRDVVKRLWALVCATQLRSRWSETEAMAPLPENSGGQRAAFIIRDNIRHRRDIEQAYLAAIGRAREEIVIANAYFFPGRTFRRALMEAVARGVRVAGGDTLGRAPVPARRDDRLAGLFPVMRQQCRVLVELVGVQLLEDPGHGCVARGAALAQLRRQRHLLRQRVLERPLRHRIERLLVDELGALE